MRLATDQPAAGFDSEARFGEIVIVNRSMFEIMGIASRSVQVPDEHLQAGLAAPDENVLGDILTIRNSMSEPKDAAIAVQHKGTWFYIEPVPFTQYIDSQLVGWKKVGRNREVFLASAQKRPL